MADITTAETMTAYSLIGGIAAGLGGIMLAQRIKTKQSVAANGLIAWASILGVATIISVIVISKAAK